jgi:hypothetical protein
MKTRSALAACAVFARASAVPTLAAADEGGISVVFSGVVSPNTRPAPAIAAFTNWCTASGAPFCVPTTQFPVYDTQSGKFKGKAYI